ncbi:MAG: sulfite exporter TauE/SafE family protein [Leptospiraceae bacterium]|nr:sulfite exporter TauE/SafE family protein [Leptospiraceae bacterium]
MGIAILATAFMQGFLGSTHCIGMCGPFVGLLNARPDAKFASNFLYNLGRTLSYASIGCLLGILGWGANRFLFADIALYLGSSIILIYGLSMIFPIFPKIFQSTAPQWLVKSSVHFLKNTTSTKLLGFLMGIVSGLLPCGLLYPAYSLALLAGDPLHSALVMIVFSLGTYPMLYTLGLGGRKMFQFLQNRSVRVAIGIFLVIFAIFTIYNRFQLSLQEEAECEIKQEVEKD